MTGVVLLFLVINQEMAATEVLDIRQAVNDDATIQSTRKPASNRFMSFVDRYKWWIIGAIAIIALIVVIIIIVRIRKPQETFVSYDPSDAKHRKIDTTPVTTYLESYISSALGCDGGSVNPYVNPYKK